MLFCINLEPLTPKHRRRVFAAFTASENRYDVAPMEIAMPESPAFACYTARFLPSGERFRAINAIPPARFIAFVFACLTVAIVPAAAQRTVTKDAGLGRKIVLHYNAADQITETDTLGPNGELLEKDVFEFRPNAYVPQVLNTSYRPNGKPHKVTHNTYDDNSNFTGEFVQLYDESGKQIPDIASRTILKATPITARIGTPPRKSTWRANVLPARSPRARRRR